MRISELDLDRGVGVSVGVIVSADEEELDGEKESVLIEVVVFAMRSHGSLITEEVDQTDNSGNGLNEALPIEDSRCSSLE